MLMLSRVAGCSTFVCWIWPQGRKDSGLNTLQTYSLQAWSKPTVLIPELKASPDKLCILPWCFTETMLYIKVSKHFYYHTNLSNNFFVSLCCHKGCKDTRHHYGMYRNSFILIFIYIYIFIVCIYIYTYVQTSSFVQNFKNRLCTTPCCSWVLHPVGHNWSWSTKGWEKKSAFLWQALAPPAVPPTLFCLKLIGFENSFDILIARFEIYFNVSEITWTAESHCWAPASWGWIMEQILPDFNIIKKIAMINITYILMY